MSSLDKNGATRCHLSAGLAEGEALLTTEVCEGSHPAVVLPASSYDTMVASIAAMEAERDRQFPLCYAYGNKQLPEDPKTIPWIVAVVAWHAYDREQHGQSLERNAERGGFYVGEMDKLHPEWRLHVRRVLVAQQKEV